MNCYISRNYKGLSSAGNKAKTDIEAIMADMGFKNVGLAQTTYNNTVLAFLRTLCGVAVGPLRIHRGDVLVVQYPLKKYFTYICNTAHLRGAKVVALIHDLGSFRRKALTVEQEMKRLNHADVVIAHNESMQAWLADHGCRAKLTALGIFDYLSPSHHAEVEAFEQAAGRTANGTMPYDGAHATELALKLGADDTQTYSVLYAGALNLRKNAFLYQFGSLAHHYIIHLYGNGFDPTKAQGVEHIRPMGFVKSDDLIAEAQGHFGLVWDGETTRTCSGNFGEYLQYNNPHKTSLYLRCGLPVIIWSRAALAPFIREHGVGICIDALEDLDEALTHIDAAAYRRMRLNAQQMAEQLNSGAHTRAALLRAIELL